MTDRLHRQAGHRKHGGGKVSPALVLMGALALAMIVSPAAAGKIYKWVDEQGGTHYGSERPVDAPAENLRVNTEKTGTVTGQGALAAEQKKIDEEAKAIKEKGVPAAGTGAAQKRSHSTLPARARRTRQHRSARADARTRRKGQHHVRFRGCQAKAYRRGEKSDKRILPLKEDNDAIAAYHHQCQRR